MSNRLAFLVGSREAVNVNPGHGHAYFCVYWAESTDRVHVWRCVRAAVSETGSPRLKLMGDPTPQVAIDGAGGFRLPMLRAVV